LIKTSTPTILWISRVHPLITATFESIGILYKACRLSNVELFYE
jgi:hypothetical protein